MSLRLPALVALVAVASFGVTARVALTASNSVPPSSAGYESRPQGVADLAPADCANPVSVLVTGSGSFAGTPGDDLILGSAGADTVLADAGNDCILGGDGDDDLSGEAGADTLIGGAGTDVCTGGTEVDVFPRGDCETPTQ